MNNIFPDSLSTAVFTTKYVLMNHSPILHVYHYEDDGAWQFSGEEDSEEEDYRIVSLKEMIEMDSSILKLANMPLGYYAKRIDVNSEWEIDVID